MQCNMKYMDTYIDYQNLNYNNSGRLNSTCLSLNHRVSKKNLEGTKSTPRSVNASLYLWHKINMHVFTALCVCVRVRGGGVLQKTVKRASLQGEIVDSG